MKTKVCSLVLRFTCVVVVLILLISVSAGCAGGPAQNDAATTTTISPTESTTSGRLTDEATNIQQLPVQATTVSKTDIGIVTFKTDAVTTTSRTETPSAVGNPTGVSATTTIRQVATTATAAVTSTTTTVNPKKVRMVVCDLFPSMNGLWAYELPVMKYRASSGIEVEALRYSSNHYLESLVGILTSGDVPDIAQLPNNMISTVKYFQPLENLGYNFSTDQWDREMMKQFTFNGKTYATLPANSPYHEFLILKYSTIAAKRLKKDPLTIYQSDPSAWTWDVVWQLSEEYYENRDRKVGYDGIYINQKFTHLIKQNAFVRYDASAGRYVNLSQNPNTTTWYKTLYETKWIADATLETPDINLGRALFAVTTVMELDWGRRDTLGFVPLPTDTAYTPVAEFTGMGVPIGAKNTEVIPELLLSIFGEEQMLTVYTKPESRKMVTDLIKRGNYYHGIGMDEEQRLAILQASSDEVGNVMQSFATEFEQEVEQANKQIADLP